MNYGRKYSLALVSMLLICLAIIPSAQAQATGITSVADLTYPSQVELQDGWVLASVTFTVSYNYYNNPYGFLAFGVYDRQTSDYAKGTASARPLPCRSVPGTKFANAALCAIVPPLNGAGGSYGSDNAFFTLTFTSPQQYNLRVVTFVWDSTDLPAGSVVSESANKADFAILVTGQAQTSTVTTAITVTQSSTTSLTSVTAAPSQTNIPATIPPTTPIASAQSNESQWVYTSAVLVAGVIALGLLMALVRRRKRSHKSENTRVY